MMGFPEVELGQTHCVKDVWNKIFAILLNSSILNYEAANVFTGLLDIFSAI